MQAIIDQVKTYFDERRYLEAYGISEPLWKDPRALAGLKDADSLILTSRLANLLGADKLSNALARRATKRFSNDPWVRFNYAQRIHGFKHHYDRLKYYDAHPLDPSGGDLLDALHHAQRAVDWAYVREFDRAHRLLKQAFEIGGDEARLCNYRARVLLDEDRPDEALADAERSFELKPLAIYALSTLNSVLARLNRHEEAAERTWQMAKDGTVQTYRYIQTVMHSQGTIIDHAGNGGSMRSGCSFYAASLSVRRRSRTDRPAAQSGCRKSTPIS